MKKLKRVLKKYIGEILIIIGTALYSYNIFNFSYRTSSCGGLNLDFSYEKFYGVAYFYRDTSIMWISLGFTLIVAGVLIIRNRSL